MRASGTRWVGSHRAADVSVDVDAVGTQRVPDRHGGEIRSTAPQRRDRALFGNALKAGHDRHDAAIEQRANRMRLNAHDLCIAVRIVSDDAGLRTGQRRSRDSGARQLFGNHSGSDRFARGEQQVGVRGTALAVDKIQERIGCIWLGMASKRRHHRNGGESGLARIAHAVDHQLAQLCSGYRRAAKLEHGDSRNGRHAPTYPLRCNSSRICTAFVAAPLRS